MSPGSCANATDEERGSVKNKTPKHRGLALALLLGLLVSMVASPAQADSEPAMGAAAALCSLVYSPAKLAFAGLGTVVSGLAWAMTGFDGDVARPIFYSAVRGDYVITPSHLEGRRPVEFVGRDPRDEPPRDAW
jgi:hypothetical protein